MKTRRYTIKITVKTGLRIGGLKEGVEIGGVDNPVIRTLVKVNENEYEELPYIPGSSLKGKLRSLLDLKRNHHENGATKNCPPEKECPICRLFGSSNGERSRIIIRDLYPTKETIQRWNEFPTVYKGTEIKPENTISRTTGKALHPRFMERVVPGSVFEGEIVLIKYREDDENTLDELENLLKEALNMLSESSYLGGSGTRGYGQVEIDLKPIDEGMSEAQ